MDENDISQMADFLSIALNQMERENYEISQDFVSDVYERLCEEMDG